MMLYLRALSEQQQLLQQCCSCCAVTHVICTDKRGGWVRYLQRSAGCDSGGRPHCHCHRPQLLGWWPGCCKGLGACFHGCTCNSTSPINSQAFSSVPGAGNKHAVVQTTSASTCGLTRDRVQAASCAHDICIVQAGIIKDLPSA